MTRRRILAAVVAVVLLGACSGGGDDDRLVLDGSPRFPDAEGVVEEISLERITLDGDRTYKVAKDFASFSTYDLGPTPLLHRKGQYVQLGLDGDTAEWMAGVGVVVRAPDKPPVVFFNGYLVHVKDGQAVFRNGTVLRLADGVKSPAPEGGLRAEIDPERHEVRALVSP
ncbi:MAG: hypothetical protein ACRDZ3_08490 [Acidimicrobiia bacterium]